MDILLSATPAFVTPTAAVSLFANVIDQTGAISQYALTSFLTARIGIPLLSGSLFEARAAG